MKEKTQVKVKSWKDNTIGVITKILSPKEKQLLRESSLNPYECEVYFHKLDINRGFNFNELYCDFMKRDRSAKK